jgi:hypothetical protein
MELEVSVHCSQEPDIFSIQSQMNPVYTIPVYLSKIHFNNILHLSLILLSGLLPSGFPLKTLCAILFFSHACNIPFPSSPTDLIIPIIFGYSNALKFMDKNSNRRLNQVLITVNNLSAENFVCLNIYEHVLDTYL